MKQLVLPLLVSAVWLGSDAYAADPRPLAPTTPQVPAPRIDNGPIVLTSAISSRVLVPFRERVALAIAPSLAPQVSTSAAPTTGLPLPTGYVSAGDCADYGCNTARRENCYDRLKAWLCFYPTTGESLPKLRPAPYVGPIAGTFPCTPVGPIGCGSEVTGCASNGIVANGFSTGGAVGNSDCKTKNGLLGRFGFRGECVPPGDGAFPGYKFATAESQAAASRNFSPVVAPPGTITSTSYKPTESIKPVQVYPPPLTQPLGRQ